MHVINHFANFIHARHAIWERRAAGAAPPWTDDPILRVWRFCNIYRELDKVTTWVRTNWRVPYKLDPDLWFACAVARYVNEPEVLTLIGYPIPWKRDKFLQIMAQRKDAGKVMFNPAYLIVPHNTSKPKPLYIADNVLAPMWRQRQKLRPKATDTLNSYHVTLDKMPGVGSFMAAQIIADLKYTPALNKTRDWWTFAASGPGSRRGLNRVLDRPYKKSWVEKKWRAELEQLQDELAPHLKDLPPLHAQDLQNALCEWDKYERTRLNQGTPRRKYNGGEMCSTIK